ncbi:hypothetical protein Tco_0622107 [Tanacetum coccineum]
MVRSMMSQTTLSKSFWDYALETVVRNLNMVPTKKVEKTPYEVWKSVGYSRIESLWIRRIDFILLWSLVSAGIDTPYLL